MKRVLFVINTMGRAGAEVSLLNLLYEMPEDLEIDLLVLLGQGEMLADIPSRVNIINKKINKTPVNSAKGAGVLKRTVLKALLLKGGIFKDGSYILKNYSLMKQKGEVKKDKLLWRVISDTTKIIPKRYDLAVAFLEGGSAYYVAERVDAEKKVAFIHVDHEKAGYTKELDKNSYEVFDKIFTVSEEVRTSFIKIHPDLYKYTDIFRNILNADLIKKKSCESLPIPEKIKIFFDSEYKGLKLLTIGRLTRQKNWEKSILAAGLLKQKGIDFRWLLLGEGEERNVLSEKIKAANVEDCFFMPGAVENPYPYIKQCDIYVHCSAYEGKSIAIQEAKILGKPLVVSDVPGNREQVDNNKNGLLVHFKSNRIADGIIALSKDEAMKKRFAEETEKEVERDFSKDNTDIGKLLALLSEDAVGKE